MLAFATPDLNVIAEGVEGEWQWLEPVSGSASKCSEGGGALARHMMAIETSLRCAICNEFLNNPHSLQCGHSFCSECIRRHLDQTINPTTSGICPSCRAVASVAQLRPEKTIVELVGHFRASRQGLLDLVRGAGRGETSASEEREASAPAPPPPPKKVVKGTFNLKKLAQPHFYKQSRETVKSALERLTEGAGSHLRTDGDKDALERRYKDFVHINNAQLDAPEPLSVEQIVAEVHRRENARLTEAKRATKTSAVVEAMRSGQIPAEAKSSFDDLIKKAREHKASLSKKTGLESSASNINTVDDLVAKVSTSNEIDDWRMVMSEKLGKVFYYNVKTKIGQFSVPTVFDSASSTPQLADEEDTAIAEDSMRSPLEEIKTNSDSFADTEFHERGEAIGSMASEWSASPAQTPTQVATQYPSQTTPRKDWSPAAAHSSTPHSENAAKSSAANSTARGVDAQPTSARESSVRSGEVSIDAYASQSTQVGASAEEETEWNCAHCTFLNAAGMSVCEMCLSIKPRSKSSLRQSQRTHGDSESSKRPRR